MGLTKKCLSVSVIIPMYNSEKSIMQALISVLSQTYKPIEIILIDDGSCDRTAPLINEFMAKQESKPRIILLENGKNRGPSYTRNRGWEAAQADLVAFLDADDVWLEKKLEVVVEFFKNNPDAVLVGHEYRIANTDKRQSSVDKKISVTRLLLKNPFATPCVTIKRGVSVRFNVEEEYNEDHDLFLRLTKLYGQSWKIKEVLTVLSRKILSKGGQSENRFEMRKGEIRMFRRYLAEHKLKYVILPLLLIYSLAMFLQKELMFFILKIKKKAIS
jgi:teichuronic acid biosynthesis glycosyltransferase TuaG